MTFFLTLLKNALWNPEKKLKIPYAEFSPLMKIAEQQTVLGLILDGIGGFNEPDAPKDGLLQYIGIVESTKQDNKLINKEVSSFAEACRRNGIDCIVVKGQLIAQHYPQPELRMPGDIDFLIKEDYSICRGKVERMMDVSLPEKLAEKEIAFNRGDYIYELHESLVDFGNQKNVQYWNGIMEEVWNTPFYEKINDVDVRTLPPTVNAAYLFIHLFFHFIRGGIGLRQLCDWAVYLNHYKDEIDRKKLQEILSELDLLKAYRAFGWILVDKLWLPLASFPMQLDDKDRKWEAGIMRIIMDGGNFGRKNHNATNSWLFKAETLMMIIKNCIKYYPLAPRELRTMVPYMVRVNWRLMANR